MSAASVTLFQMLRCPLSPLRSAIQPLSEKGFGRKGKFLSSWSIYLARIAYFVGLTGMFACSMTHIQNQVPAHRRTEVIGISRPALPILAEPTDSSLPGRSDAFWYVVRSTRT